MLKKDWLLGVLGVQIFGCVEGVEEDGRKCQTFPVIVHRMQPAYHPMALLCQGEIMMVKYWLHATNSIQEARVGGNSAPCRLKDLAMYPFTTMTPSMLWVEKISVEKLFGGLGDVVSIIFSFRVETSSWSTYAFFLSSCGECGGKTFRFGFNIMASSERG